LLQKNFLVTYYIDHCFQVGVTLLHRHTLNYVQKINNTLYRLKSASNIIVYFRRVYEIPRFFVQLLLPATRIERMRKSQASLNIFVMIIVE